MVCTTLQIALFVALAGGAAAQSANRVAVPSLSLRPLFEGGTTAWRTGGTSVVHQSIIRLTSDVQHQRGWLTSSEKAQVGDAWEVDFTFRVTGQAEQFFGDGLALWYTERPLQQGPVFGAKDNFKGLGIFFDTYDNRDRRHAHRHPYISSMLNDGSRNYQFDYNSFSSTEADVGCHSEFRYRFETTRETKVRMTYKDRRLVLSISLVDGKWAPCFTRENVDLPSGYFFGVSASTGDLSDNHDVLDFEVYRLPGSGTSATEVNAPEEEADELDQPSEEEMESINNIVSDTDIVKALRTQAESHASKLSKMHRKIESEMQTLNSHIVSVISKLQAAENEMDRRVRRLEVQVENKMQAVVTQSETQSRAWVMPFLGLVAVTLAVGAFAYRKYRHLLKTHLP